MISRNVLNPVFSQVYPCKIHKYNIADMEDLSSNAASVNILESDTIDDHCIHQSNSIVEIESKYKNISDVAKLKRTLYSHCKRRSMSNSWDTIDPVDLIYFEIIHQNIICDHRKKRCQY